MSGRRTLSVFEPLIERVEASEAFDNVATSLNVRVDGVLREAGLKDLISGTTFGHSLHPALTDVVIGAFLSANALDAIGGEDSGEAASRLIALGIAAYGPTALTGASDWTDGGLKNESVRRVGLAHAAANSLALTLYAASFLARRRGRKRAGVALGAAGAGALGLAGYLGGHLTLVKGVGVDQTVFGDPPSGWTDVGDAENLEGGLPIRVVAGDVPVMVVRIGRRTHAMHDRCSHRGCSLSERGEIDGSEVVCNCHGSRFSLADGALLKGPATRPQPSFEARVRSGRIQVRPRPPSSQPS